jgi:uncharacterized protein (TIGR02996 family)
MSMAYNEAFLKAILAEPDDDTVRLIYADWFEEHGELDRAEFIRVQCQAGRLPPSDRRQEELSARAQALLTDANWSAWGGMLRGMTYTWQFRRGFVKKVWMGVKGFQEHAERVMRMAPVRHIQLIGAAPILMSGLASPWLDRLITLDTWDSYLSQEEKDALRALFGDRVIG